MKINAIKKKIVDAFFNDPEVVMVGGERIAEITKVLIEKNKTWGLMP